MRVSLTLRNLANATVAHVHGGPGGFAGVAPPLVQIAVGNYTNGIFVMTPGACSAITSGNGYINVHTAAYPAGLWMLGGGGGLRVGVGWVSMG